LGRQAQPWDWLGVIRSITEQNIIATDADPTCTLKILNDNSTAVFVTFNSIKGS
jgi:hypothetical protein